MGQNETFLDERVAIPLKQGLIFNGGAPFFMAPLESRNPFEAGTNF